MPMGKPYEHTLVNITFEAAGDLSLKQFHFCKMDTAGRVLAASVAGELCIGVLQGKPAALGRDAVIAYQGVSIVEAAGNISPGQLVTTNNAGKAVLAATGNRVLGTAITPGASGAQMAVMLGVGAEAAAL